MLIQDTIVLHGGGGPDTVAPLAAQLSQTRNALAPTHPGWDGTPRAAGLATMRDYARLYLTELAEQDLRDVLVVGSSLGGWIGAEMALGDTDGRIARLALVDAVGIDVPGEPIADIFALDPQGIAERTFHDPARMPSPGPETLANFATVRAVAGDPYMHDPGLLGRLGAIAIPTLVLWGESDRIVTPAYGRAYAAAIPGARFETIPAAGHLPQLEQPEAVFAALDAFAG